MAKKFLISMRDRENECHRICPQFPPDIHPEEAYIDIEQMRWSNDMDKFFPDPFRALFTPFMTEYICSRCGEKIPMTNVFAFRQTWLERVLGDYRIAGFWCPKCGDPWTRCERIPPKIFFRS